ncbi:MAG: SDR family oxidoreductase [Caldisphaeraceae archaeon]|nr:SDR family oxidoreductase [Caldisphaeraceae archaeon]
MINTLENKVVVITGASSGIGRATALLLATKGCQVVLASRDNVALEKVAQTIKERGGMCEIVPTDVRDEESVKSLFRRVIELHGRVDILVNSAGIGIYGSTVEASVEEWDQVINTNLKGVFLCTREALSYMTKQRNGHIISIASKAGEYGLPKLSVYCASKFGVIGFSQAVNKEVASLGIKISYLCPGYVETKFLDVFPREIISKANKARPDDIAKEIYSIIISEKNRAQGSKTIKYLIRRLVHHVIPQDWHNYMLV